MYIDVCALLDYTKCPSVDVRFKKLYSQQEEETSSDGKDATRDEGKNT